VTSTDIGVQDQLDAMRRELRYVRDRLEIRDVINSQARGHDRHDLDLMSAVYHDDGIDEHGPTVKAGADYGEWANQAHSAAFQQHSHNITTHTCEIDGDVAHCESYVIVQARSGKALILMGGRYIDRLERRDGKWKIALRRCTVEWTLQGDGSALKSGNFAGFIKGTWDTDDVSYARPLTRDDANVERW
jgi:hypothetical protein